uniref:Putative secreted protein n=1 Tax=Anopheles marajoara TaxID=58244 RepID=A0A2M4C5X9_9DIPT
MILSLNLFYVPVATGAKERLVQITGPNEEKINYAKQLIEDTIRRNASPVRLDSQDGSCSSLASSASDETVPRKEAGSSSSNARSSLVGALVELAGNATNGMAYGMGNQQSMQPTTTGALTLNLGGYSHAPSSYTHPKLSRNGSQNNGQRNGNAASGAGMLLHSFSTNDASLGEYKYTVNVGQHNLKITGDCLELVKVAKLVLDDYFSSNEFLASVDMCTSFDLPNSLASPVATMAGGPHSLITGTPFVDSGVGLNTMSANVGELGGNCVDLDDDVFVVEPGVPLKTSDVQNTGSAANNGLSRSRRSHFSRKDSAGEGLVTGSSATNKPSDSNPVKRIDYERLIYYAKSPFSWELPADWQRICDVLPNLVKNKDIADQKNRFNGDLFLELKKQTAKDVQANPAEGGVGGVVVADADGGEGGKTVATATAAPVATADGAVESGGKAADPIDAVATAVPSAAARV